MTDLKEKKVITPEKAAVLLPTFISSLIVLIVFSAFVIPKFINSNKVYFELQEFKRKKNELPDLNLQVMAINKKLEKLNAEKDKIINLISGTTNLDTFLTRLGKLASKNNIRLISVVPKSLIKYVESDKDVNNDNVEDIISIDSDSLLVEGLKKNKVDVTLKSNFKNLLSFLNEIEFQENVIFMRNINIKPSEGLNSDLNKGGQDLLMVSLQMIIYGKI